MASKHCPLSLVISMRLRASTRGTVDNCFARLAPNTARQLLWEEQQQRGVFRTEIGDWSIHTPASGNSDRCESGIEFLPLVVTVEDTEETIYVSYNGGNVNEEAENDSGLGVIQLPFGWIADELYVLVQALPRLASASQITVKAESCEDWELLQLEADWLESAHFLGQVCLVYPGQCISLHLANDAIARIRVLESNFLETTEPCFWLTSSTLVHVDAPLPSQSEHFLRVIPSRHDILCSPHLVEIADCLGFDRWLTVKPKHVLVHPSLKNPATTTPFARLVFQHHGITTRVTVRVESSSRVPKGSIVLHPWIRHRLSSQTAILWECAVVLEPVVLTHEVRQRFLAQWNADACTVRRVALQRPPREPWRLPDHGQQDLKPAVACQDFVQALQELPHDAPVGMGDLVGDGGSTVAYELCCNSTDVGFVTAQELLEFLQSREPLPEHAQQRIQITPDLSLLDTWLLPRNFVVMEHVLQTADDAMRRRRWIVTGERGSGKTVTALTMAAVARTRMGASTRYVDCLTLRNRCPRMDTILAELCSVLDSAGSCCMVVLDDLDALAPQTESSNSEGSLAQSQQNPVETDQSNLVAQVIGQKLESMGNIAVVITCRSLDSLSVMLRTAVSLSKCISTPELGGADREALFRSYLKDLKETVTTRSLREKQASGFRPRDIEKLAQRVKSKVRDNQASNLVQSEIEGYVPLCRLGVVESIDHSQDDMEWSSLGGLFAAKKELTSSVLRPSRYKKIYGRAQVRTPRGVFLFGFPGTGKTACIHALAREGGFSLIKCKGPEILDKFIGASEAKVRQLFARAAAAAPSILFLDEIDSLAPRRGSDHTGVTDRIVNQLLTFLDGVEDFASSGTVVVVAATSRPDKVDPALLRPGRLERHVFFGDEVGVEEQADLFLKVAKKYHLEPQANTWLENNSTATEKFTLLSAADIHSVFRSARLLAINDAIAAHSVETVSPRLSHLEQAICRAKPSLAASDRRMLTKIYAKFMGKPAGDEPNEQFVALR